MDTESTQESEPDHSKVNENINHDLIEDEESSQGMVLSQRQGENGLLAEETPDAADSDDKDHKHNLFMGELKKDDSGIVLEKSPFKEYVLSSEENHSDSSALSLCAIQNSSKSDRPSTSYESEGLVADFAEVKDDDADAGSGAESKTNDGSQSQPDISSDSEDNLLDSESTRRRRRMLYKLRNRNFRDTSSEREEENEPGSSSSVNASDHEDASDVKSDSDDSEAEMDIETSVPKDPWNPLYEIRRRELGHSNGIPASQIFRDNVGSSINLVQRLERRYKLEHHEGCVNALHFNSAGTLLASGSDDLNIVLWNWAAGKIHLHFDSGHRSNVFQAKFMPYTGDTHIVSCARDGQIRLAELSSTGVCKCTKKLAQHRGAAHKLALLHDSSHKFYSCGEDAVTYEVDLREEKPKKLSTTKENNRKVPLYSIHSNPQKSFEYCVGGRDHFIRIYDSRMIREDEENGVMKKFYPHHLNAEIKANVTCAVYNYNGTEILGSYNDEDIYLFDSSFSDGADFTHRYRGHRNNVTVKGVNFYGPRSEFIVSGSDCANVFLWEKNTEKIVQCFHADEGGVVNVLEPHPNLPILATSGLDHDIKVWTPTATKPATLEDIKKVMRKNRRERDRERINEPALDGQMLWLLMHHLRRSARRRAREEGEDPSSTSSEAEDSDDGEASGGEELPVGMQCASS